MAHQVSIAATRRTSKGKGAARSLRRAGSIPAVVYGHNREPESVTVDAPALGRALIGINAESTIFELSIDGAAPAKALIREIQRDPIRRSDILHVDFYEVRADEAIRVAVPVHLTGTADGVRNFGGVLDFQLHSVDIEVLPSDIPEFLELDVNELGVGQSLHVGDLKLAKGRILTPAERTICSVLVPRVDDTPAPAEAAAAEPELIRKAKPDAEGDEEK